MTATLPPLPPSPLTCSSLLVYQPFILPRNLLPCPLAGEDGVQRPPGGDHTTFTGGPRWLQHVYGKKLVDIRQRSKGANKYRAKEPATLHHGYMPRVLSPLHHPPTRRTWVRGGFHSTKQRGPCGDPSSRTAGRHSVAMGRGVRVFSLCSHEAGTGTLVQHTQQVFMFEPVPQTRPSRHRPSSP